MTALFFQQVSIFTRQCVHAHVAARVLAISAITMVLAMPLISQLLDRSAIFACATLNQSAALRAIALVKELASALLYAGSGLNNAAMQTHYTCVWPRFFGRRYLGSTEGTAQTIGVVGGSIRPLSFGAAFDLFGDYTGALLLFAAQRVLRAGVILALPLPPPRIRGRPGSVSVVGYERRRP